MKGNEFLIHIYSLFH